jgi:hypothetical protein
MLTLVNCLIQSHAFGVFMSQNSEKSLETLQHIQQQLQSIIDTSLVQESLVLRLKAVQDEIQQIINHQRGVKFWQQHPFRNDQRQEQDFHEAVSRGIQSVNALKPNSFAHLVPQPTQKQLEVQELLENARPIFTKLLEIDEDIKFSGSYGTDKAIEFANLLIDAARTEVEKRGANAGN